MISSEMMIFNDCWGLFTPETRTFNWQVLIVNFLTTRRVEVTHGSDPTKRIIAHMTEININIDYIIIKT